MPLTGHAEVQTEGPQGGGGHGKAIVLGFKDREAAQVRATIVDAPAAAALQGFVRERVAESATVYTDDASAYKGMPFAIEALLTQDRATGIGPTIRASKLQIDRTPARGKAPR